MKIQYDNILFLRIVDCVDRWIYHMHNWDEDNNTMIPQLFLGHNSVTE